MTAEAILVTIALWIFAPIVMFIVLCQLWGFAERRRHAAHRADIASRNGHIQVGESTYNREQEPA